MPYTRVRYHRRRTRDYTTGVSEHPRRLRNVSHLGGDYKRMKNLKMSDAVYALRQRAIKLLYEARETVPELPWIQVRITENSGKTADRKTIAGLAQRGECAIWIPLETINADEDMLRKVVFHEVVHAVWGIGHDENCPLMRAIVSGKMSKAEAHRCLRHYADNYKEKVV